VCDDHRGVSVRSNGYDQIPGAVGSGARSRPVGELPKNCIANWRLVAADTVYIRELA
jgi:hypothetical protein